MSLEELIKERISQHGPISVAEYMALALSHPEHGYYMKKDPLGASGDFTTSPEISQIFGELMGAWLASQWELMGKPEAALIELGPGRGTLMNDMLRITKPVKGFHEAISVHLVETSPALKAKQWKALAGKHEKIEWHESVDDLPADKPWLIIANEFFDALPIRQFVFEGEWKERMVGVKGDKLVFITSATTTLPSPISGEGFYEYCEDGIEITHKISAHIAAKGGAAMVVDYGHDGKNGGTLQAVKAHQFHEVLSEPGEADLTAHVDFAALKVAAKDAAVYGPVPQGKLLMELGAGYRVQQLCAKANDAQAKTILSGLERIASPDQMGDLFKALAILPKGAPKPEGF